MKEPGQRAIRKKSIGILIAEDSLTQATELQALLQAHGYAVTAAPDGKAALAAARAHKPALVISDVMMPELDGYGLCKALKSDETLKDIPVMLVTALSDPRDVVRGLECGADNFVRKPYDEQHLLSRIDYLLMNRDLRRSQKVQMGVEIELGGRKHLITAERQQILDLLVSTYEQAVHINTELKQREKDLAHSNQVLQGLYRIAEGLNRAVSEREVAETVLERALELPGIQAGWISLREGETGFRLAAARGLPPALSGPDAFNGSCTCRRRLLSGELDHVTNILECERLGKAQGDRQGLRIHASVPLWLGSGRDMLGVMNLAGPGDDLFDEEELKVLYNVGNQVGVALERARLHEHLEKLVAERTAKLTAEIEERKRIEREQARLVAIIEATPDFVATGDLDGQALYVNQAGLRMLGYEPGQDISGLRVGGGQPDWALKLALETNIPHAIEHGTWSGESAFLRPDGKEMPVLQVIIAHKRPDGSVEYLSTVARDITERKAQEARIVRLNRVLSVLSGINTTIVRVRDRRELFEQACRIAVEVGGFGFAWIGMLDPAARKIAPVARAGRDDGYLARVNLDVAKGAPGTCPLIAQALAQTEPVICNDVATDERMQAWRDAALARGYRSIAALPLLLDVAPVGVFMLYAPDKNAFDEDEMRLLIEMAGDISFALDHLQKTERLNYLAYFDGVTGLPNRVLFQDRLERAIVEAGRHRRLAGVAYLDLDRFKTINDSLGHGVGDLLLKGVAERLARAVRDGDTVARLGGDEFAIVLADMGNASDAAGVAHKILECFNQSFSIAGHELFTSVSLGLTLYPADDAGAEGLVRNADAAMYRAKEAGGNAYQFYAADMASRAHERLALETALRRALERREFLLHYQPVVALAGERVTSAEALVRWRHPERGMVPPGDFIPLAEETGLIVGLGEWVLHAACEQALALPAASEPLRVAVNVSLRQFRQPGFPDMVASILRRTGLDPARLNIEITESHLMQDFEATLAAMRRLGDLGVRFSIDDFGTGYSSLSRLKSLPIASLKIDQSFVRDIPADPNDASIVRAIVSMAHDLGIGVIAEGVETREQLAFLRAHGCDAAQGYYFSRPLPADELAALLARGQSPPP